MASYNKKRNFMKDFMHTDMNIHVELKKEIHVKGSREQQGSSIIVTASTTFQNKSEYDLENCFSAIKNYVDCFNKQAENSFPNIKTFE